MSKQKFDITKLVSFETKKSVHINIPRETHALVKTNCFKYGLSMQDIFEELAQMIAAEDPIATEMMSDLAMKKRDATIKRLSDTDAESIFRIIETDNPLASEQTLFNFIKDIFQVSKDSKSVDSAASTELKAKVNELEQRITQCETVILEQNRTIGALALIQSSILKEMERLLSPAKVKREFKLMVTSSKDDDMIN